jgi:ABC-type multidrug transport system permease subunit
MKVSVLLNLPLLVDAAMQIIINALHLQVFAYLCMSIINVEDNCCSCEKFVNLFICYKYLCTPHIIIYIIGNYKSSLEKVCIISVSLFSLFLTILIISIYLSIYIYIYIYFLYKYILHSLLNIKNIAHK